MIKKKMIEKKSGLVLLTIVVSCFWISACSNKSETEQLADMRDSFTYSKYSLLSSKGLALGLKGYQKGVELSGKEEMPAITQNEVCVARTLLAYGALISNKETIALVESDLIDQENCDVFMRGAAGSLRGVIFHRKKWPTLADQETKKSQAMLANMSGQANAEVQLMTLHLALGSNAVMQKDYESAQVHVDGLALLLGTPWLGKLSQASIYFKEGNITECVRMLKRLSEDPSVPEELRIELVKGIQDIESKAGNVDSSAFMTRAIIYGIWNAATEKSSGTLAQVSGFVKSQMDDVKDSSGEKSE